MLLKDFFIEDDNVSDIEVYLGNLLSDEKEEIQISFGVDSQREGVKEIKSIIELKKIFLSRKKYVIKNLNRLKNKSSQIDPDIGDLDFIDIVIETLNIRFEKNYLEPIRNQYKKEVSDILVNFGTKELEKKGVDKYIIKKFIKLVENGTKTEEEYKLIVKIIKRDDVNISCLYDIYEGVDLNKYTSLDIDNFIYMINKVSSNIIIEILNAINLINIINKADTKKLVILINFLGGSSFVLLKSRINDEVFIKLINSCDITKLKAYIRERKMRNKQIETIGEYINSNINEVIRTIRKI